MTMAAAAASCVRARVVAAGGREEARYSKAILAFYKKWYPLFSVVHLVILPLTIQFIP